MGSWKQTLLLVWTFEPWLTHTLRVDIIWRNYQWNDCLTEDTLAAIPI